MNQIVAIIRRCRIHSRVLLDNGQSKKISTVYAVVGTFIDSHDNQISMNDPTSNERIPLAETTNETSKTIHIVKDCDFFIEETDRDSFIDKCVELETKGLKTILIQTTYLPQQDPPNVFYFGKFKKRTI